VAVVIPDMVEVRPTNYVQEIFTMPPECLHGVEQSAQLERLGLEIERAGLDLGHVEQVVDQPEQVFARRLDHPSALACSGLKPACARRSCA
jgi:hypothetical protein